MNKFNKIAVLLLIISPILTSVLKAGGALEYGLSISDFSFIDNNCGFLIGHSHFNASIIYSPYYVRAHASLNLWSPGSDGPRDYVEVTDYARSTADINQSLNVSLELDSMTVSWPFCCQAICYVECIEGGFYESDSESDVLWPPHSTPW